MSVSKNCLFYDRHLGKILPCFIVPNMIYSNTDSSDWRKYCKIMFDQTLYTTYGTNQDEIDRYSIDSVKIIDIYPARTLVEIAYATSMIPNKTSLTHEVDELNRMEQIITMITDSVSIKSGFFYKLADFISYELLFTYLNHNERVFMMTMCNAPFTLGNIAAFIPGGPSTTPVPQMIRMTKRIFDQYPADTTIVYGIQNIGNLAAFDYIPFPLGINIPIMRANINFLSNNSYI